MKLNFSIIKMKYLIGILAVIMIIVFIAQLVVGIISILPSVLIWFIVIGVILFIYFLVKSIKENL